MSDADDLSKLFADAADDDLTNLTNGTGSTGFDLTIESVLAAQAQFDAIPKAPPLPRVVEKLIDGELRWCIRINMDLFVFPAGTTYEHACSVLSEATAKAAAQI